MGFWAWLTNSVNPVVVDVEESLRDAPGDWVGICCYSDTTACGKLVRKSTGLTISGVGFEHVMEVVHPVRVQLRPFEARRLNRAFSEWAVSEEASFFDPLKGKR